VTGTPGNSMAPGAAGAGSGSGSGPSHIEAIETIAREAGALLKGRFGSPGDVLVKGPLGAGGRVLDLVTELDTAAEALIVQRIAELTPGASVLAEEGGARMVTGGGPVEQALADIEDLWIVDPLDGTINYASGIPLFCVSIARYRQGIPVAGAIYAPMLDELFTFAAGERPPQLNGEPLLVSSRAVNKGVIALSGVGPHFREVARHFLAWRRIGSAALTMAWVAAGRLDGYIQLGGIYPWDHAAGVPLIIEAGGVVTDESFQPWRFDLEARTGIVTGSSAVHTEAEKVLRELL